MMLILIGGILFGCFDEKSEESSPAETTGSETTTEDEATAKDTDAPTDESNPVEEEEVTASQGEPPSEDTRPRPSVAPPQNPKPATTISAGDSLRLDLTDGKPSIAQAPKKEPVSLVPQSPVLEIDSTIEEDESSFSTYRADNLGLEVKFPKDWLVNEAVTPFATVIFSSLRASGDTFADNVSIIVQDISQVPDITLEDLESALIADMEKNIEGFAITSRKNTTLDGQAAREVLFSGKGINNMDIRWRQIVTLHEGRAYVFMYTAQSSEYNTHLPNVELMLPSVRLF